MLENFDPKIIEDEVVRQVVVYLMNELEKERAINREQAETIQRLQDEVNRLKGEQGKPKIKGNKVSFARKFGSPLNLVQAELIRGRLFCSIRL